MRHWDRYLAGLTALLLAANGVAMLGAPLTWYDTVPGVPTTGPFNPHFVRDIGAAYLVVGASLAAFAWRPREAWAALAAAAAFLTLHAGVHVFDAVCGTRPLQDVLRDLGGVYLPAAIAVLFALRKPA